MRNCPVCRHAQRDAIDREVLAGKPHRVLGKIFGLSRDSILRHSKHMAEIIAQSNAATEITHAGDLVGLITQLERDTQRLQEEATAAGDRREALAAIRERTRLVELRAKIAGEIRPSQVNVLNLKIDESQAKRAMEAYLAKPNRLLTEISS